jgi:hypothetical protein
MNNKFNILYDIWQCVEGMYGYAILKVPVFLYKMRIDIQQELKLVKSKYLQSVCQKETRAQKKIQQQHHNNSILHYCLVNKNM